MTTLYAFCRQVDDVADEDSSPLESRRIALQDWREDVQRACDGGSPRKPLVRELQLVIDQYGLQFDHFDELIKGWNRIWNRIESRPLRIGTVLLPRSQCGGLLSVEVFGYRDAKCQDYMVAIGKSLQYTNILRDIGNDAERGRIYLPQEAMEKFGVEPRSILNGKYSTAFHNLAAEMAVRARQHFQNTVELLPAGDRRSMVPANAWPRCTGGFCELWRMRNFGPHWIPRA